ncbi:MAG TPA: rRNA maturation RNase YbeY [Candidatus Taylorbacteria bacterium]|nr:MAG: putative rRNA maturation factor [Parcubacteria group bacterium GW2011_GWA2_47_64]KKU96199.1 MAG: putative rRNA maturation factor [Parcubacteria group bacterium GW2011_GWC2_48_17]HBV00931.1 rRNA maturation RNase YbeY [Candidatus Taylorbacteria bacterium]
MKMLSIRSLPRIKPRISRFLLLEMKNAVLPRDYELSVAFVDTGVMREINGKYRNKRYSTDILSFPLSPCSGEIIFSMKDIEKRAPMVKRGTSNFLAFLFIHGLLHLKGYSHGSRMEREEEKIRRKFNI